MKVSNVQCINYKQTSIEINTESWPSLNYLKLNVQG